MGGQSGSWTPTKRRGPIAAEFQGPGPAALTLPALFGNINIKESSKHRSPSYTFGSRYDKKAVSTAPAPNAYNTSGLNPRGKDDPKAPTMHIKPKDPKAFVTPSPGAYNPEAADKDVKKVAPKYSFGIKGKDEKIRDVPAPNAYSPPNAKDAPSYSLSGRPKESKKYATPAPGTYDAADTSNYKVKSPAYSLSTRYNLPSDNTMKPGPGAYTPEKIEHTPEYAFGIKHSPYLGSLKGDTWIGAKTESPSPSAAAAAAAPSQTMAAPKNNVSPRQDFTPVSVQAPVPAPAFAPVSVQAPVPAPAFAPVSSLTTSNTAVGSNKATSSSVINRASHVMTNGSSHAVASRHTSSKHESSSVKAGSTHTSSRTHSDGHRIRTETFSYTKGPTTASSRVTANRLQRTEVKDI